MRHPRALLTSALLIAGLLVPGAAHAAGEATHIVQLRPGYTLAQGQAAVAAAGGTVTGRLAIIRGLAAALAPAAPGPVAGRLPIIRGLAADLAPAARARLARDPSIAAIDVNAATSSQKTD